MIATSCKITVDKTPAVNYCTMMTGVDISTNQQRQSVSRDNAAMFIDGLILSMD